MLEVFKLINFFAIFTKYCSQIKKIINKITFEMLAYPMGLLALVLGIFILYTNMGKEQDSRPIAEPIPQPQQIKDITRKTFHIGCFLIDRVTNHHKDIRSQIEATEYQYQSSLKLTKDAESFSGYSIDFNYGNFTQSETIIEYQQKNIGLATVVENYINSVIGQQNKGKLQSQYYAALKKAQSEFESCKRDLTKFDSAICKKKWTDFKECLGTFQLSKEKLGKLMRQQKAIMLKAEQQSSIKNSSQNERLTNQKSKQLQAIQVKYQKLQAEIRQKRVIKIKLSHIISQLEAQLSEAIRLEGDCAKHLNGSIDCLMAIQMVNALGYKISNRSYIHLKFDQHSKGIKMMELAAKFLKGTEQQKMRTLLQIQRNVARIYLIAILHIQQAKFSCKCPQQTLKQWRHKIQSIKSNLTTQKREQQRIDLLIAEKLNTLNGYEDQKDKLDFKYRLQNSQSKQWRTFEQLKKEINNVTQHIRNTSNELYQHKYRCQILQKQLRSYLTYIQANSDCIQKKNYFIELRKSADLNFLQHRQSIYSSSNKVNGPKQALKNLLIKYEP